MLSSNSQLTLKNESAIVFKGVQILFVLGVVALLFMPGINGSFYFDDIHPFSKLTSVTDFDSAMAYVFTDTSGILGRKISMLTFLLHIDDWPNNSQAFFTVNIAIHLLCGALVYCISVLLMKLLDYRTICFSHHFIGLGCAFLWLILPIHSATVLIAIQRMTQLSTLFILAGLSLYLYGLYKQKLAFDTSTNQSIRWPVLLQLSGAFLGTSLAMFSKENGVLLPVFGLVFETTVLANCIALQRYRKLRMGGGVLALILVLVVLCIYALKTGNELDVANYTLIQRFITQPLILLDYIRLSFIPAINSIHPFHDSFPVEQSALSIKVLVPIIILICAVVIALRTRKSFPLISFAIFWFLVAHLIESTVIPLELVFLHRNYLALVGPAIAITFALSQMKNPRLTAVSYFGYSGVLSLLLVLTTATWGNQLQAAEKWLVSENTSKRASMHLAELLFKNQRQDKSAAVLDHYVQQCDSCLTVSIQLAQVRCFLGETEQVNHVLKNTISMVPDAIRIKQLPLQMRNLAQMLVSGVCSSANINQLYELNEQLLKAKSTDVIDLGELTKNIILISAYNNDVEDIVQRIRELWQSEQDVEDILSVLASVQMLASTQTMRRLIPKICHEYTAMGFDMTTQKAACTLLNKLVQDTNNANT
ncbi:MAG: hypothetical protein AAGJ37_12725 [Pseudomonadota bacterium]